MKAILVSTAGLVFLGTMLLSARPEPKITICHVPPGNPANIHEITIGASAWEAHETHCGIVPDTGQLLCDFVVEDPTTPCEAAIEPRPGD